MMAYFTDAYISPLHINVDIHIKIILVLIEAIQAITNPKSRHLFKIVFMSYLFQYIYEKVNQNNSKVLQMCRIGGQNMSCVC